MMKKTLFLVSVVISGLIVCACENQPGTANTNSATTSTTSPATAAKADPQAIEDAKALVAKHDKALNDKNVDAVIATFSSDPKTVLLGTGQGERFVGTQAIREAYTEILKDYDAGTLDSNCDWKAGGIDAAGTTAWVAATCQMKDSMKGVKREYVLNVSGALEKQGPDWKFVMLHMSNATGGPPVAANTKPGGTK